MAITRIKNNQITDASAGNIYLGVNAATKLQDYSITSAKIANDLTYNSSLVITGNLTVQGNTTTIDTTNLVVEDPLIILASEQTGAPALDIGYIGQRGTEDNIAFIWDESADEFATVFTTDLVTNTTITINGYASLHTLNLDVDGNIDIGGNITITGNIAGNLNITGNLAAGNISAVSAIDAGTTITAVGNIDGGNLTTANQVVATGNVTGGNLNTAGEVVATGNVTGGNLNTAGEVVATGNVTGGNLVTAGQAVVTGNVTGGNINTAGTVIATGNIDGGNVNAVSAITAGTTITATGNVIGGNITTAGVVEATGNVIGGNITTANIVQATGNVIGGNLVTVGNVDGANINATANVTGTGAVFTGNITASTFIGNILGNIDAGGPNTSIQFNDDDILNGSAAFTFDKTSNLVTASGNISAGNLVTTGDVTTATVTASQTINATGNITGGNLITAGLTSTNTLSATGNANVGNLGTTGLITAIGNISGGNLISNAAISAATTIDAVGNITGGNIITAGLTSTNTLSATGNANVGNLGTGGLIVATGNIDGGNINTIGDVTATGNVNGANVNTNSIVGTNIVITATSVDMDLTGNLSMSGRFINDLGEPSLASDAATKQYVDDAVSSGIHIHTPVDVETPVALPAATYNQGGTLATVTDTIAGNTVVFSTAISPQVNDQLWFTNSFNGVVANIAYFVVSAPNTSAAVLSTQYNGIPVANITNASGLTESVRINSGYGANLVANTTGALTVDGFSVSAGNRVLVYNQNNAFENGIYDVTDAGNVSAAWILTRSDDANSYIPDSSTGLDEGTYVYVKYGDTGAGESYVLTAPVGPFNIGQVAITFTQFSASQVYSANTQAGLVLNGTVFSAKVDNDTTAFDGGGNISVKVGANLVTPNIGNAVGNSLTLTDSGLITAVNIDISANVLAGNVNSNAAVTGVTFIATGNITGGNIDTVGQINATGNISGGNLISNNAISASTTITATGNVTGGNINTAGQAVVTGNVTGGNIITAGEVVATGNVTGGNLVTAGNIDGANLNISGAIVITGNVTGGNIVTAGQVVATGNVNGGNLVTSNLVTGANVQVTTLTTNRVVYVGTDDYLVDSANFTFDGANANLQGQMIIDNFTIDGTNINSNANISVVSSSNGNIDITPDGTGVVNINNIAIADNTISSTTGNIVLDPTANIVLPDETASAVLYLTADREIETSSNFTYDGTQANIAGNLDVQGVTVLDNFTIDGTSITSNANLTITSSSNGNVDVTPNGTGVVNIDNITIADNTIGSSTGNIIIDPAGTINLPDEISNAILYTGSANQVSTDANLTYDGTDVQLLNGNIKVGDAVANTFMTNEGIQGTGTLIINQDSNDVDFAVNGDTNANIFYIDAGTETASFGDATQTTNALVAFNSTTSILVPVGNSAQRPAVGVTGMVRFNTTTDVLEFYDADSWVSAGSQFTVIDSEVFNGDGSTLVFTLGSDQTTDSCIVSINGIVQIPIIAYSVSGNVLTFTEAPLSQDVIEVRQITTTVTVKAISNTPGNAIIEVNDTSNNIIITGDIIPIANVVQDIGSLTNRFRDIYLAGNSIYLGNLILKNTSGNTFAFFGPDGTTPGVLDSNNVDTTSIANGTANVRTFSSDNTATISAGGVANVALFQSTGVSITGDLSVTGNATLTGNILGDRIQNGTTQIDIQTQDGNANITVGGVSNVAVFSTTGVTVTGNVNAGNLNVTNNIIDSGPLEIITSSNGNITLSPNGSGVIVANKDIRNGQANGVGNIGTTGGFFNTIFAKATSAQYADLAEMYETDAEYPPGTVMHFGGDREVTICDVANCRKVAGVVSTNPSYLMNSTLTGEHVVAVALTGRVPCRVRGPVIKGDLMVSAGDGSAMANNDAAVGTVIGKALEDFSGTEGVIEVVVGRV